MERISRSINAESGFIGFIGFSTLLQESVMHMISKLLDVTRCNQNKENKIHNVMRNSFTWATRGVKAVIRMASACTY